MGWGKIGDSAADKTNQQLKERELSILLDSSIDFDSLKPTGTSEKTYNELMAVIQIAKERNETVAQLQSRIKTLGSEAIDLTKKLTSLIP